MGKNNDKKGLTATEVSTIKLETKFPKLERLVKWERIDEVNEMIMHDISPRAVSSWCCEHGFTISVGKMYEYKEILKQALAKQVTVERMLGIGVPRRSPVVLQSLGVTHAKNLVKNEIEVLDAIIQKGFNQLLMNPEIKLQDALRAIEMKNKLTNGAHGGLTNFGLDQLRELEKSKFDALVTVVLKYLPEDKVEEVQAEVSKAEREFYEQHAPELLEDYDNLTQEELDKMNALGVPSEDMTLEDIHNILDILPDTENEE